MAADGDDEHWKGRWRRQLAEHHAVQKQTFRYLLSKPHVVLVRPAACMLTSILDGRES
jgi:hypothetical protein